MTKSPLRVVFLAVTLLLALGGCQWRALSAAQDADLRGVFEQVRRGDLAATGAAFDPQFRPPTLHADLPQWRAQMPAGTPQIQRLNQAVSKDKQGRLNYGASYEYDFPGKGLLVQVEKRRDLAGKTTITAFRVVGAPPHIADHYRFSLTDRKPFQYAFLFLAFLSPALGLWGMAAVWRAPDIPRRFKPIWTIAMAIGFMDLTMDWANGDVFYQTANLHILFITARKFSPVSPWMISTSLPLASIAFLLGYRPPKKAP